MLPSYHGFWQSLLVVVLMSLAATYGFFTPVDGLIYDFFVRNGPDRPIDRRVALVSVPLDVFTNPETDWRGLADGLLDKGARQVAFTFVPSVNPEIARQINQHPGVTVGANITPDPEQPETNRFKLPASLTNFRPDSVSTISDPLLGVHRYQHYAFQVGGAMLPSLEALTARRLGIAVPDDGRYLVDFRRQSSRLPRLTYQQATSEGLVDAVVRNRVVLIGPKIERFDQNVVTPITAGERQVDELEFHGFATDSLLRNASIASLPGFVKGLIIAVVWLVAFMVFQTLSLRKAALTATGIALGLFAVVWIVLIVWNVHVPIVGALLSLLIAHGTVMLAKSWHHQKILMRLVNETNLLSSTKIGDRTLPADDSFWSHVLAMVDQILPITRAVLLERQGDAKHLKEIRTLRCSIDVIAEKRRDFRRTPYLTAIERNGTVEADGYLKDSIAGERQFLVPLVFEGQVLGFWAFGIVEGQAMSRQVLMHAVESIGQRLSQLLYERYTIMTTSASSFSALTDLNDQLERVTVTLGQHLRLIYNHLAVLEDMFNGLNAPTILYDLFGRTMIANRAMEVFLAAVDAEKTIVAAPDLLEKICGMSADQARAVLANVIFEGHAFEQTSHVMDTNYLIVVTTLRDSAAGDATNGNSGQNPLLMHGLMIQLFRLYSGENRRRIAMDDAVRNANAALEELGSLRRLEGNARPEHVDMMQNRIVDATSAMHRAGRDEEANTVSVSKTLEAAIAVVTALPQFESVTFAVDMEQGNLKVADNSGQLNDLLASILQLLAADAREPGSVTINARTEDGDVRLEIRNTGYGIPNEMLQEILRGTKRAKSENFRRIMRLRESALGATGRLEIHSEVGSGFLVGISMRAEN